MEYSYVTLTRKIKGFFATDYFYMLDFLNQTEVPINFPTEFKSFDEGVSYLGSKGYLLTNVLQAQGSDISVTKGWFAKQVD